MNKITYCCVHLNQKEGLQKAIRRVAPYVDRVCIVDGGSTDGTIEWLSDSECKDLKVEFVVHKQYRYAVGNHTPKERNIYLNMAGTDGWILVTDSDEFLEEEACKNLRSLIDSAENMPVQVGARERFTGLMFRPHDIWTYEDGRVYDKLADNHWTMMAFKAWPGQKYIGHTHSTLIRPGLNEDYIKTGYEYTHEKDERALWRNSSFLYWTTSANVENKFDDLWIDFHDICNEFLIFDWHDLNRMMIAGIVPEKIKEWFIENRDSNNPEIRAYFNWYFIFNNPSQNTQQLGNRDFEWNYVERSRK